MKALLLISLLSSQNLMAAGAIPTDLITVQLVNVFIFIGILVYFLRPVIKNHFQSRKNLYVETVNKAEVLKKDADAQKAEIESKIASFKSDSEAELKRTKEEAEKLKASIIEQGEALSANIKKEAQKTIENELSKAKANLKQSILEQSLNEARSKFASNLSGDDHKNMNKRFVDSVGAN